MALPAGNWTLVDLSMMKAEKEWSPYFGASSVPCATDSSSVAISSPGMVAGPRLLRLYSNGHPGQCPNASNRQSCFSMAELELLICQSYA